MDKDKKTKKNKREEKIEAAKKEMDDLMKSIQGELGDKNVKVVQIKIPRATFKNFLFSLLFGLLINTLLFVGTSGFYDFIEWKEVLDIVLYAVYFTVVAKVLDFIFIRFFTPLIIKTLGIASFLPYVLSLAIALLFPIFVIVDNIFITLFTLVFIMICERWITNFIQNKFLYNKSRRKK